MDLEIEVADATIPGGEFQQAWHISGRTECYFCHNPWAGYRLAFTPDQLDRSHEYGAVVASQVATLEHTGLLEIEASTDDQRTGFVARGTETELGSGRLVNPHDESADLNARARSYLHVNCAHCHRFGGGGTAVIDLRVEAPRDEMQLIDTRPTQGAFRISDAALVAPGRPSHSVLYYRAAKLGRGRMPYAGSQIVDQEGLELLADWIGELAAGESPTEPELRLAADGLSDDAATGFLSTTSGALHLMNAIEPLEPGDATRQRVVELAASHELPEIRDLFERFLPPDQRVQRLGAVVDVEEILNAAGDAERGRALFFDTAGIQCKNCHRIGEQGTQIGPDLTSIAEKNSREQLLESIIDPSKKIDPKYVMYLVETDRGLVHSGLLIDRTESELVLRTTMNEELRFNSDELELIAPQTRSLMPDLLFRDMTAEQLADLLAYLETLK